MEVLTAVLDTPTAPADTVINDDLRARRYMGSKDRRAVLTVVWRVLRHRARLTWWLQRVAAPSPETAAQQARWLVLADTVLLAGADPDLAFIGGRHAPAPANAQEQQAARALAGHTVDHPHMPPWVRGECPEWLYDRLPAETRDRDLAAMLAEAPTDLRANRLLADRDTLLARFLAEDLAAQATPLAPDGIRLGERRTVGAEDWFRTGQAEIQDEGSQIVALMVGAAPGMKVVDFCAGAGGKTLALAAMMHNRGRVVALDVSEGRIHRARQRLRRAGVQNVFTRTQRSEADPWVRRHRNGYDRVLVDAPCSNTGTWRRNPDARWRLTDSDVTELVALQQRILTRAAALVKPGGRLIYATCSRLEEENQAQAEWFLETHPGFHALPAAAVWRESLDTPPPVAEGTPHLVLGPASHGTDAFYTVVFEKAPDGQDKEEKTRP